MRRFQSAHGLAADGIVGPRTRLVLRAPVALARVPASVGPGARSLCARCSGIYARSASIPAPSTGASVPGRRTRFSSSRRLAAWRSTESSVRTPRVDFRGRTGQRRWPADRPRSRLAEHADATAGAVEHPPTATTPGPAHRRPPIVATPAKKPGRSPDGLDPLGMAAVIALIAIAGLLLVAGGVVAPATSAPHGAGESARAGDGGVVTAPRADRPNPGRNPRPVARRSAHSRATGAVAATDVPRPSQRRRPRPTRPIVPRIRALGYVSVPPDIALDAGAEPQAQAIEAACGARRWTFVGGVREPEPANGKEPRADGPQPRAGRLRIGRPTA